jgi:lysophospholipase L1-like esterase
MQETNKSVRELATNNRLLIYADTAAPMLGGDGMPRRELFLDDGLHLNAKGYQLWTSIAAPIIKDALATD